MKKRKVLYISGTRADYGLMRSTLKAIKNHPRLKLSLIVTGMHLSKKFGYTVKEIKRDSFKIETEIPILNVKDSGDSMGLAFGKQVSEFSRAFQKIKPDIILVEGDRGEMLAGAIAGRYLDASVAHVCGGDVTPGCPLDDSIRHTITKLSHIHFPGTKKSAERIIKMGEEPWRIFMVGDPGTDSILQTKIIKPSLLAKKFNLDLNKPILLVIQHPVSNKTKDGIYQIRETMEALVKISQQSIVIYPNADTGGRAMIKVIEKYKKYPFIKIYPNIPHNEFISLMKIASVMVGNSSSGIVEAPLFKLPVVNIGPRELKRERGDNVIDVDYNQEQIEKAIRKALFNKKFKEKIRRSKNPYIAKNVGREIAKILSEIKINKKLLEKSLTY